MIWTGWVQAFAKDLSVRGLAVRTRETYLHAVRAFVAYLAAHEIPEPSSLTLTVLEAYQGHLFEKKSRRGRRLSLAAQSVHLAAVRAFCSLLRRRGAVLLDPSRDLVMPKVVRKLPRAVLTPGEVSRFLRAIPTRTVLGVRDRAVFETLYSTGVRISELIALAPGDIDFDEGFLRVRAGKGGRSRVVPLGRIAGRWIARYLEHTRSQRGPTDPLFLTCRGGPLIRNNIALAAGRYARLAKITKRVTCHAFRHACATHMLQGRASLRHIQELLGHASPVSTQIYAQVAILDLKRVHRRCHPRNRQ